MRELFLPLFYHWSTLNWLSFGGSIFIFWAVLYGWSLLWNKSWAARSWPMLLGCALLCSCPVVLHQHADVAEQLSDTNKGKDRLKAQIQHQGRLNSVMEGNIRRLAKASPDKETFLKNALRKLAEWEQENHSSHFLPFSAENALLPKEAAELLEEMYRLRNTAEVCLDNPSKADIIFEALRDYIVDQQWKQNKEKMEEVADVPTGTWTFIVILLVCTCCTRCAYRDIMYIPPYVYKITPPGKG